MQAIRTRFIPCTNNRDSRIQAKCEAKTIYVVWDDSRNIDENHKLAAIKLASLLDWHNEWVAGVFDGDYYWTIANTPMTLSFNSDKGKA